MSESARAKGRREDRSGNEVNQGDHMVSRWTENATGDNTAATATRAAESGKTHYVTAILASYSAAAGGQVNVKDGASSIFTIDCHDQLVVTLVKPLAITAGNAVSAELAASGGSGNIGTVTLIGYTA